MVIKNFKFNAGRGFKGIGSYSNELLRSDDLNFQSEADYHRATELLIMQAMGSIPSNIYVDQYKNKDFVISGFEFYSSGTDLNTIVTAGAAVSTQGRYYDSGAWGFVKNAGDIFSVVLPQDTVLSVDNNVGGANYRYDLVEIRPIRQTYNTVARQFRDPITGLITSSLVNSRTEFTCEIKVVKGNAALLNYCPPRDDGWIKIGEIATAPGALVTMGGQSSDVAETWCGDVEATHCCNPSVYIDPAYNLVNKYRPIGRDATGKSTIVSSAYGLSDNTHELYSILNRKYILDNMSWGISGGANKLVARDVNGRSQISDPQSPSDIATKNYIDGKFYDIIIDSNSALDTWCQHTGGFLKRVYIKSGTWTASTLGASAGKLIDLASAGTTYIFAERGASINYSGSYVGTMYGLWRTALVTDLTFERYENLKLNITNTAGICYGAYNITNLINCNITVTGTTIGYVYYFCSQVDGCSGSAFGSTTTVVFNTCTNLVNCFGSLTQGSSTCSVYNNCTSLSNCNGTAIVSTATTLVCVYQASYYLSSCTGSTSSSSTIGTLTVFAGCYQISVCSGTLSGNPTGTGGLACYQSCEYITASVAVTTYTGTSVSHTIQAFNGCNYLTGCKATATGSSNQAIVCAYNGCKDLSNCYGTVTAIAGYTGTTYGFQQCAHVIGCAAYALNAGSGNGYGFSTCTQMQQNRAANTCKTGTYNGSYADVSTNACANTAAGGYNAP